MNETITFPMLGDGFSINPSKYFSVFGLDIHWYGVIIAAGFILAVIYMMKRSSRYGLSEDNLLDMLLWTVPIGIIGARIYYVIFNFSIYANNLSAIYKIREGGLAIYGGIIFGAITVFVFCRVKKIHVGAAIDLCSFGVLIGQAVGRWGNFINREAYGAETSAFCRMGLTNSAGTTIYVHPTFLYESLWNIIGFLLLSSFVKRGHRKFDGQIFLMYLVWYGIGRFWIESLRTDSLFLFSTGIRVSQLVALLSIVIGGVILIIRLAKKPDASKMFVNVKTAADGPAAAKENSADQRESEKSASDADRAEIKKDSPDDLK